MATTGELRAIIKELQLIDAGEAASFLGEEAPTASESHVSNQQECVSDTQNGSHALSCKESSCH